ncbi:MAG: hypothetical protein JOZ70_07075 [Pseudolabrys sp.]|nr:hypothetical protein [Pseudolabrys sp.]MBV9954996.1 hypothetical protein [Pseudolabrys sp.]
MKKIHALTLATALVFTAGAAMAQSSAPTNAPGASATENQKSGTVKADGVDQAKKGPTAMPAGTTGAAMKSDQSGGQTKDKGGLDKPSMQENKAQNTQGPK